MLRSLFSGTSGLRVHQLWLDVVGSNISNVNTTGYKDTRTSFKEAIQQTLRGASAPGTNIGGVNAQQVGLGSSSGSIDSNFNQGNLETTSRRGDLAIEGNGLFILRRGTENVYTRNGAFEIDADGNLVSLTTGLRVQGWNADNRGVIDPSQALQDLIIPIGGLTLSRATTSVQYLGNLDAEAIGYAQTQEGAGSALPGLRGAATFGVTIGGTTTSVDVEIPGLGTLPTAGGAYTQSPCTVDYSHFVGGSTYDFTVTSGAAGGTSAAVSITVPAGGFADVAAFVAAWNDPANWSAGVGPANVRAVLEDLAAGTVRYYDVTGSGSGASSQFTVTSAAVPPVPADVTALGLQSGVPVTYGASSTPDSEYNALVFADSLNSAGLPITASTDGTGGIQIVSSVPGVAGNFTLADQTGSAIADYFGSSSVNGGVDVARSSVVVYDSLGVAHTVDVEFSRIGSSRQWEWTATDESGSTVGSGSLNFSSDGQPLTPTGVIQLTLTNPQATSPQIITLHFDNVQQFAGQSTAQVANQDGVAPGTLQTFSVSQDGVIVGEFSNGLSQAVGQVALATFQNNGGLVRLGSTLFRETVNSGAAQVGTAGSAQRGTIQGGTLEASNVDLADQFTKLIIAERGFQANSRIMTTSDEILQELVNLKR